MEWSDPVARCMFVESEARRALTVVAHSRSDVEDAIRSDAYRTDSPIEAQFATWFSAARGHQLSLGNARFALQLRPQTWVECESGARYRVDFVMEPMDEWLRAALCRAGLSLRIGIELDGHDFHERTREQVIERNRRDRDLSGMGWRVLHYSGSELRRNPMVAVAEVLTTGADALDTVKAALFDRRDAHNTRQTSDAS